MDLPANRHVWRIAAPMMLSNITVPLLGMVDTGVTGHLDDAVYLAAVAVGATIFGMLYTGVNFLRMGTTGIAAQRFGANDADGMREALGQAGVVALLIATLLLIAHQPLGHFAVQLVAADPDIAHWAYEYFAVRIWSAPATLLNFALIGWFIGLQDARVPFLVMLVINLTNIVLDLIFVVLLGMKVEGVALASVIAEIAGLAVGLVFAARVLRRHGGEWHLPALLQLDRYRGFFSINAQLLVRTLALMFTFAFITAQGARLGGLVLAANAILLNLQHLLSFALDGIAHAAEALVGKAIGARDRAALQQAVKLSLRWSLLIAGGFTLLFIVGGPLFIRIMTDLPDVRATTLQFLPWIIASPLISAWSFLYDGVYVGATRAREMRNIMLISTFLVFLPAWYLLQPLGNHGLWLAFLCFMASRGIGMHYFYKTRVLKLATI